MRNNIWLAGFGLLMLIGVGAAAEQSGAPSMVPPQPSLSLAQPWKPPTSKGTTQIVGSVVDIRQVPVAGATVQLRNLTNGTVEQETITDENGEYRFEVQDPGTYVVEMMMPGGLVAALSNAGTISRDETLQTVVQLAGRWDASARSLVMVQGVTDFVGMNSNLTMTANTMAIATGQDVRPTDNGEPVSAFRSQ